MFVVKKPQSFFSNSADYPSPCDLTVLKYVTETVKVLFFLPIISALHIELSLEVWCVSFHICVCLVAQLCPPLCDPMNCSQTDSSVHGVLQARTLEWVAISFSSGRLEKTTKFSRQLQSWAQAEPGRLCCTRGKEDTCQRDIN